MKTILAFTLLLQAFTLSCQDLNPKVHRFLIGINFSYFPSSGASRIFRWGEGDPMIQGQKFYSGGISCSYSLNKNFYIESGVVAAKNIVRIDPWGNENDYFEEVPLLYIPVQLRCTFLKYVFATGGIFFGFDFSEPGEFENQSGIGISIGQGLNYEFGNGISVFINPYINFHSYVSYIYGPFTSDKTIEAAIRLGVSYRL